ncbi:unnamed protein product [Arctogadus glacialis]
MFRKKVDSCSQRSIQSRWQERIIQCEEEPLQKESRTRKGTEGRACHQEMEARKAFELVVEEGSWRGRSPGRERAERWMPPKAVRLRRTRCAGREGGRRLCLSQMGQGLERRML